MMRRFLTSLLGDERGAVAAEFVLVVPVFIAITIGTMNVCVMAYSVAALNFAAQKTARCVSVSPGLCSNVQTFGASQYKGATAAPVFALTAATATNCGNLVTATATYKFTTGLTSNNVTLSGGACFPSAS